MEGSIGGEGLEFTVVMSVVISPRRWVIINHSSPTYVPTCIYP